MAGFYKSKRKQVPTQWSTIMEPMNGQQWANPSAEKERDALVAWLWLQELPIDCESQDIKGSWCSSLLPSHRLVSWESPDDGSHLFTSSCLLLVVERWCGKLCRLTTSATCFISSGEATLCGLFSSGIRDVGTSFRPEWLRQHACAAWDLAGTAALPCDGRADLKPCWNISSHTAIGI